MLKNHEKSTSCRSIGVNLKYLIANAWKWDKSIFAYCGLYTLVSAILPFIVIIASKLIIDELTGPRDVKKLIFILISFFIISTITNYLTTYLSASYYPKMSKIRFKFMYLLQKKCMTMDFKNTEDPNVLNSLNTAWVALNNNDDGIEGVFHRIFSFFSSAIVFLGYITIVSSLSPWVLLYLVFNVLVTYYFSIKIKRYEYDKKDEVAQLSRKATYIYNSMYNFSYGKDIRIYSLNNWLSGILHKFNGELIVIRKDIKSKYFLVAVLDTFLLLFREGIIYAYLIFKVLYEGMGIGNFTMYFATISGFALLMTKVMDDIVHIRTQNLYINDFRDFLAIDNYETSIKIEDIPIEKPYEIEFINVTFKYPNSEKYVYRNLSLKIKAGQRLAVVGVNGSGKTTFVKLLTRLYEPTSGQILINGVNIATFDRDEYFKLFSVVFQEIKIFAFSIAENIAVATGKDVDRSLVDECVKKASMDEKIKSLKDGIDTSLLKILDPNGVEFSGGENQRLALARALYKNGDIVVLDEPTAALDPIAEYNIYKNFDQLIGDKTAIYISHRLASTRFCDIIAFFENGEIIEYGTHEELLNKNRKYAEMFNVQACYYKEEIKDMEKEVV